MKSLAGESKPALELCGVSARYARGGANDRREPPLFGLDLAIWPGELVVILGPNGAGKTTLLRVASGALAPVQGEARLFGTPMASLGRTTIAKQLAVVGQAETAPVGFTVREAVMMGRAPHQGGWMRATERDEAIVHDAIARCDLTRLADRRVEELSGGEQKRVAIARALAQEPRVLLLDEPAAFLDIRHQLELYDMLRNEVVRASLACVVVMHDLNTAAQYASRVGLMKAGRLVAVGSIEEVMTYRRLRETFECDLYVGVNELTRDRFFVPMRGEP